ncbi:hypothetical protein D3C80_589660 [compost metagenome]
MTHAHHFLRLTHIFFITQAGTVKHYRAESETQCLHHRLKMQTVIEVQHHRNVVLRRLTFDRRD